MLVTQLKRVKARVPQLSLSYSDPLNIADYISGLLRCFSKKR